MLRLLGTASLPLFCVPLESLAIQDAPNGTLSPQPDTASITGNANSPDEPPADLIGRLDGHQRESFLRL